MDSNQLKSLEAAALAKLQKKQKVANLQVFHHDVDSLASTGKNVFRFGAVSPNDPERTPVQIVVDEAGEEVDVKAASEREGRPIFGGDIGPKYQYIYSVKFVCGVQPAADGCCCLPGVRTGIYATEINIHNYQAGGEAWLQKSVLPLILAGRPQGREPRRVSSAASEWMLLPAGFATMDDGCKISEMLFDSAPPAGQPLNVGFLEIVSGVELKVTAVYTATDLESRSVSIDVEEVPTRTRYPYYYPFPLPVPPVPAK